MNRLFVLREPLHLQSLQACLAANWQNMATTGDPMAVRLSIYRKDRSNEQNALMWVWLDKIAQDGWASGQQFSTEIWHEYAKRELLPDECARGIKKWRHLPTGERILQMGTSHLNTEEMGVYLDKLQAWAVTEVGVELQ